MDSNSRNRVPPIIEIGDELDDDVIDLDGTENTPEDIIYEWDAKIRKKLLMFSFAESETFLCVLMKEYLETLQEMAKTFEGNDSLKKKVFCHITFLYSYYVELQCCTTSDSYLSMMEEILTVYTNLELDVIRPIQKKNINKCDRLKLASACRRIVCMLTIYLLERNDHILHVLIKINTNNVTDSCSEILNAVYKHFLTKVPAYNLGDESFCRSYIVFQKWKDIRKEEDWEHMDKIMYKMFNKTSDSIKNSETLRKILMPASHSPVDIVFNLFRGRRDITNAYFNHIATKKNVDLDDLDFNIDLGEDEPTLPVEQEENDEDVKVLEAYYEVERNMSNLKHLPNNNGILDGVELITKCKEEVDDDDEVEFVGITMLSQPVAHEDLTGPESTNCSQVPNVVEDQAMEEAPCQVTPAPETPPEEPPNGIAQICIDSVVSIAEKPDFGSTDDLSPPLTTQAPSLVKDLPLVVVSEPAKAQDLVQEVHETVCETKSVEVQADSSEVDNCGYNDYGFPTPPSDVPTDEQTARAIEPRLYASISQKDDHVVHMKAIEVQADLLSGGSGSCGYDGYGLTPPSEPVVEDHRSQERCLYADIGCKDKERQEHNSDAEEEAGANCNRDVVDFEADTISLAPNLNRSVSDHESDFEEDFDHQLDATDFSVEDHILVSGHEGVETSRIPAVCEEDVEDNEGPPVLHAEVEPTKTSSPNLKLSGQIDTGQKHILNTAPNIETKDITERLNGIISVKPLMSSNRTNGQNRDVTSSPAKIMYTSSHKIKAVSLEDFNLFESGVQEWNKSKENNEFADILSGPLTKITPARHNILTTQDKLDIFGHESNSKPIATNSSRSSSPTELTSPPHEDVEDFRNYYSDFNGRVPPPHDIPPPQGILKKESNKKKNLRIAFHESTFDGSEGKRPRTILVMKKVRMDKRLNMKPQVVLERLSFIENKLKSLLNNPPTIRVDYDKTTNHINENDVVRCISPPRLSWIVGGSKGSSMTVKNLEHLEKKPKKRKAETLTSNVAEPAIFKRRAFRAPKKKSLAEQETSKRRRQRSTSTEDSVHRTDSAFDKLINSGAYSSKPFRMDLLS